MKKAKIILSSLFWGAAIGGTLGIIESIISIRLWIAFGSPDFLIRPNRAGEIELTEMALIGGGIIAGLIFGIIVGAMVMKRQANIRFFHVYLRLISIGAVIYMLIYTLTLTFKVLPFSLVCDPFLFFWGLRLTRKLSLSDKCCP